MIPTCTDIESARTWRCKVCTTSLAVNAPQPKCHWTPLRRLNVHVLPSGLMCQSVASIGTKWCHGSSSTRASYTGAYWAAKTTVMRMGSFCSRSNCTATFRRSTRGGVADGVGVEGGVCAGAMPLRVSNTRVTVMASLRKVPGRFIVCSSPVFITDFHRLQGTHNGTEVLDGVLEHCTPPC